MRNDIEQPVWIRYGYGRRWHVWDQVFSPEKTICGRVIGTNQDKSFIYPKDRFRCRSCEDKRRSLLIKGGKPLDP